jgi:dTDP-4-dehydrorhamnose 3,5-epimerase
VDIENTPLPGTAVLNIDVFGDDRGWFMEMWNADRYHMSGLDVEFVQDNLSRSKSGVLRGLHFQNPQPQGKLVTVLQGKVYDAIVDLRSDSPTYKEWFGITLSAEEPTQLYVPEGFAHGFLVTGETALFHYKCTDSYAPDADWSIRWDDPEIGIEWPVNNPILSDADAAAPYLHNLPEEALRFG